MNFFRYCLVAYVALCLGGGGAVALSPALHWLIEHGGSGPEHTHGAWNPSKIDPTSAWHHHANGVWHQDAPSASPSFPERKPLFTHAHNSAETAFFTLFRGAWLLLHRFTVPESSPSDSAPKNPDHSHQSIFQLLAAGGAESPFTADLLPPLPQSALQNVIAVTASTPSPIWELLAAPRGPPSRSVS